MIRRVANALPHLILSGYIVALSAGGRQLSDARAGSLLALLLLGAVATRERARGDLSPVGKGYLFYLAVNVAGFWALPELLAAPLRGSPAAFLYGSLLAVAALSPLFGGRRFTEYFARKSAPPAVWETEVFKTINRNMSRVWTGLFAAALAVALIPVLFSLPEGLATAAAFQLVLPGALLLGAGVSFNRWYPTRYQRQRGIQPVHLSADSAGSSSAAPAGNGTKREDVMSKSLKVVAINGSPHMGRGNASLMTQMMAPALAGEGIALEEIFLADKRIEYCVGCGVCIEKGACWRQDDHAGLLQSLLEADGLILASPVYFGQVTAQMKTFVDRSLAYGHKPRGSWKPGVAISVSAGLGETATAEYLANLLRVYGAHSMATFTAIAVGPGVFLGKELVEARAKELARDLARAIREKRRYPATDRDLSFYLFMRNLIQQEKDFMRDDFRHWQEAGFFDGFESYCGQEFSRPPYDETLRREWLKEMIAAETQRSKGAAPQSGGLPRKPPTFTSCLELLRAMPDGFNKEAAGDLEAVYQFEISGAEQFTAHLRISGGSCVYVEGPHASPDVTIRSPADVWLAVSRGELNGQAAFMAGKYRAEGDLGLLMKLGRLFGS